MTNLEDQIKSKLNIKYSAAKQLIAEAKQNLEITAEDEDDRNDEILDEATQIFEDDLLPDEQEAMRVSGEVKSNWKDRAVAAAQRRKAEQEADQPSAPEEATEQDAVEELAGPADEAYQQGQGEVEEEIVEEVVEQDGDGGELGNETVTEMKTTTVGEDGTQTITTKTVKRTVTEEGQTKVVVCCVIL